MENTVDALRVHRIWRETAKLGGPVATGLAILGVIADAIPILARVGIGAVALASLIIAGAGSRKIERARIAGEKEIAQLNGRLASLIGLAGRTPETTLRLIVPQLFRPGTMWRLTVYAVEPHGSDYALVRKLRCASSEIYEKSGREVLPIETSLFREIKTLGLPFYNESSDGPDRDSDPRDWHDWQLQVVRDPRTVSELRMPSRKYAWCAIRENGDGRTLALMAESVQLDGLNRSILGSPLMEPLLTLIVGLAEFPTTVDPVIADTVNVIGRIR